MILSAQNKRQRCWRLVESHSEIQTLDGQSSEHGQRLLPTFKHQLTNSDEQ